MKENLDGKDETKFSEGVIDNKTDNETVYSSNLNQRSSCRLKEASLKSESTDEVAFSDVLTPKSNRRLKNLSQKTVQFIFKWLKFNYKFCSFIR